MFDSRRKFLQKASAYGLGVGVIGWSACVNGNQPADAPLESTPASVAPLFLISLAQWSFNRSLFAKKMDPLDFAMRARQLGFEGIEYVNQFFPDKAESKVYLDEMEKRARDQGVKSLMIMVDNEGDLGDPDDTARAKAIENHYKWVDAARHLGCHSIRVNAFGEGSREVVQAAVVDGIGHLANYAALANINVLIENHGWWSSDAKWVVEVIRQLDRENCGTLPDFDNFCIKREGGARWSAPCIEKYDRYRGVTELMPYAKAVSAKAFNFTENGAEVNIDFLKMMKIVTDAGFHSYVGLEYEGNALEEEAGILATKALLERVRDQLEAGL